MILTVVHSHMKTKDKNNYQSLLQSNLVTAGQKYYQVLLRHRFPTRSSSLPISVPRCVQMSSILFLLLIYYFCLNGNDSMRPIIINPGEYPCQIASRNAKNCDKISTFQLKIDFGTGIISSTSCYITIILNKKDYYCSLLLCRIDRYGKNFRGEFYPPLVLESGSFLWHS